MKKGIFTLAICLGAFAYSGMAQTSDAEAEALVNLLGVQKREAIAKLVPVAAADSAAFWKIYDEYQAKNKAKAKDRITLYEQTAQAYTNLTPEKADALAKRYFDNREGQEKDLAEYYKKIKAATNPITAFEFYQAEVYLLTQIRASIMQQVPTYSEFQRLIKK
ncbi:hypothetical protein [Flavihumibacter petaseus]|uniref:Uncharacterized protein n=1 Tax=Flavihumibacter petaseus NBRC 106054 TaxID=1220578 RepID=A0A0E9N1E2_9BACT|nr:hypothetical protein [Flavihumibacter petaseus]GAO43583.1 hypothetical protein FPE01S_02_06890 [Flavihumibacter petaseus NBRC 106054]